MDARASKCITDCRELVKKHKAGEQVKWEELLDLADQMEKSMLQTYREMENVRFYQAVLSMGDSKPESGDDETIENSKLHSMTDEILASYRSNTMSNFRTYTLPRIDPGNLKELEDLNDLKEDDIEFPSADELPAMLLVYQYENDTHHMFVEAIRTSNSVEEYVEKYVKMDISQQNMMEESVAKLMVPLKAVDPKIVEFWMNIT